MLISVKLTNFLQHENLHIEFTEGLNAIRGANESGKSSVFWAIQYALGGSRCMPWGIEDAVTWGKPASTLRVELVFERGGDTYTIVRSKGNTEMVGPGFICSGAAEVNAAVERLLGVNLATAQSVLISNQDDIRRAIKGGELIEELSNTKLIETLVKKIQTKLPTGSTSILDSEILELESIEEPVEDYSLETKDLENSEALQRHSIKTANFLSRQLEENLKTYTEYSHTLATEANHAASYGPAMAKLEQVRREQAALKSPGIKEFRERSAILKDLEVQSDIRYKLKFINSPLLKFNHLASGTEDECRNKLQELTTSKVDLDIASTKLLAEMRHLQEHIDRKGECSLCGARVEDFNRLMELKDEAYRSIKEKEALLEKGRERLIRINAQIAEIKQAFTDRDSAMLMFQGTESDLIVIETEWPLKFKWAGPDAGALTDQYARELQELDAYEHELLSYTRKAQALKAEEIGLSDIRPPKPEEELAPLRQFVSDYEDLKVRHKLAKDAVVANNLDVHRKEHALALAKHNYAAELKRWKDVQRTLAIKREQVKATHSHNALIKKLREARPAVVNKMWSHLLHIISQSFSSIRGVTSIVGREGNAFTIDGKPYTLYSGSTVDSLGLAIREALQKVFLGSIDFTMVDEATKGMDAERHSNMLAQLTRTGFRQVIVITHSDIVDSYAANLIEL